MKGAPLRFAAAVVGGWVVGRVVVLLPSAAPLPTLDAAPVAAATPSLPLPIASPAIVSPVAGESPVADKRLSAAALPPPAMAGTVPTTALAPGRAAAAPPRSSSVTAAQVVTPPLVMPTASPSRWRFDGWLVVRPGGGDTLAFGQLGASQGGARLTYALDPRRRIALSARLSAPLRGSGGEAGIGIDLQPTRLPIHLLVEQRLALDGGDAQPAALAITGGSISLPGRVRIDAFVQAGGVRHRGGFADAAAIATRPIASRGDRRVEAGVGTWAAAQRGVSRLDVGPSIALVTPGAGGTLRLQLDYRARIAGGARPGSGPALTLGTNF